MQDHALTSHRHSYGETAIYLQTMGSSDTDGVTRVDWIRSLFEDERLPVDLGWQPRAEPITIPSLGLMVLDLFGVSPQKVPEGKKIAQDSYKDVFEVLVGGSKALNNITGGLAEAVGL